MSVANDMGSQERPLRRRSFKWGDGVAPQATARIPAKTLAVVEAHARAVGASRSWVIEHILTEWAGRQSEAA
jgi:Ribbon-helix-helix protein, copG family